MAARDSKSKRRSARSARPDDLVFFVDRCLGKITVAKALREAGAKVEVHDDHFPVDEPDVAWIDKVGHKGWIVLTRDERIVRRTPERQAVVEAKVRMFMPSMRKGTAADWARTFAVGLPTMLRFVDRHSGPFVARVLQVASKGRPRARVTMLRTEADLLRKRS